VGSSSQRKTIEANDSLTAEQFSKILKDEFGIALPVETHFSAIESHMANEDEGAKKAMEGLTA